MERQAPMPDSTMDEMKEELAKLVAAQAAEDVWTTPAMEEKLRIKALGTKLAKTGDPKAQLFVVEQARLCKHIATAGDLASTLVFPGVLTTAKRTLNDCAREGLSPELLRRRRSKRSSAVVVRGELADVKASLRPFGGLSA
jgi:hypothetical protein